MVADGHDGLLTVSLGQTRGVRALGARAVFRAGALVLIFAVRVPPPPENMDLTVLCVPEYGLDYYLCQNLVLAVLCVPPRPESGLDCLVCADFVPAS